MSDPLEEVLEERAAEDLGDAPRSDIVAAIEEMVAHPEYPCLGARSVFRRDAATLVVLDDLADTIAGRLPRHPRRGAGAVRRRGRPRGRPRVVRRVLPRARCPAASGEFEALLWGALQHLHDHDDAPVGRRGRRRPRQPALRVQRRRHGLLRRRPAPRTPPASPAGPRCRRWCSTCTSSSSGCAPTAATSGCATPSAAATPTCRGLLNPMVSDHGETLRGPAVRRPRRARRLDPAVRARPGCQRPPRGRR